MIDQPAVPSDPYQLVNTRHGAMLVNRHDQYVGRSLIEYGEYCEPETEWLRQWIDRPATVVEVGANIGSQTVALAKAAQAVGGDVVAFEPQLFVFQNLCANLALNALSNVTAWPYACGAQSGTVWLNRPDYERSGNFGGVSVQPALGDNAVQMPCVKLDDVLHHRDVRLMKIDVEGFELEVLRGAEAVIANQRPVLYVENDRVEQSRDLIEFLWQRGYRLFWHIVYLFNPTNFRSRQDDIFPNLAAFNMICLPREWNLAVQDAHEITDSSAHPLARA